MTADECRAILDRFANWNHSQRGGSNWSGVRDAEDDILDERRALILAATKRLRRLAEPRFDLAQDATDRIIALETTVMLLKADVASAWKVAGHAQSLAMRVEDAAKAKAQRRPFSLLRFLGLEAPDAP
jgi:hypothetical protein